MRIDKVQKELEGISNELGILQRELSELSKDVTPYSIRDVTEEEMVLMEEMGKLRFERWELEQELMQLEK